MPELIHLGVDELLIRQELTLRPKFTIPDVVSWIGGTLERLGMRYSLPRNPRLSVQGVIVMDEMDVRVARRPSMKSLVDLYLRPEAVHFRSTAVYGSALRLLGALHEAARRSSPCESVGAFYIARVAVCADLAGWKFSSATAKRLVLPSGSRLVESVVNGRFTGVCAGPRFRIYDKTYEIGVNPSKAWVRSAWTRPPGKGETFWRVEVTWDAPALRREGVVDPGKLWPAGLDRYSLVRKPKNRGGSRRSAYPLDPTWEFLRGQTPPVPWEEPPNLPPKDPVDDSTYRKAAVGRLLGGLAGVIACDDLKLEFPEAAKAVVAKELQLRPHVPQELMARVSRARSRLGKPPLP